jgi:hypothetical protein
MRDTHLVGPTGKSSSQSLVQGTQLTSTPHLRAGADPLCLSLQSKRWGWGWAKSRKLVILNENVKKLFWPCVKALLRIRMTEIVEFPCVEVWKNLSSNLDTGIWSQTLPPHKRFCIFLFCKERAVKNQNKTKSKHDWYLLTLWWIFRPYMNAFRSH